MIFAIFLKMDIPTMVVAGIRKTPEIHSSYHFFDVPKKRQFRLKMEVLKLLRIQPILTCILLRN